MTTPTHPQATRASIQTMLGKACNMDGFEGVGFDIDGEYVNITNRRLACDKGSDVNDGMRSTYVLQR